MLIYIGADHRGFTLKEQIVSYVKSLGYEIFDVGAHTYNKDDDYPVFAKLVGEKIHFEPEMSRGILVCGSGAGMDVAANKFIGVRAFLAISADQVYAARHDDNANVLILAAEFTDEAEVQNIVKTFLATPFGEQERYKRRLEEIRDIEQEEKLSP